MARSKPPSESKPVPRASRQAAAKKPAGISPRVLRQAMAESLRQASERTRRTELNPFQIAQHPKEATPPKDMQMAMDSSPGLSWGATAWAGGYLNQTTAEGLLFLGYPYLAELAQRPEYRVISETIATEMTRKWIRFQVASGADGEDKSDRIKELTEEFERLQIQDRFKNSAIQDGFFGRGHIFLDTGASDEELKTPIGDGGDKLSKSKIGKGSLKRLQNVEAVWTYPTTYNAQNPLREDWYNPQVWYVMGRQIHCSRLLTFIGHPVPDLLKPAYSFGGLSLSQMAQPYVNIWLQTRESVGALIHAFSVMVLKTDMSGELLPGGMDLFARVAAFNMFRDNQGCFILNKNTEDFENVSASLAGLHELQSQSQEHMMSVARIPAVKFTGMQPSGLNASSEGEIRVFYDTIAAMQESFFRPNLTKIFRFVQLSLWGDVDPDISFEFEPLWALSEREEAEVRKLDAETDDILVNGVAALRPEEVRKRVASDPDTLYPGLDVDDVPEPPDEAGEHINIRGTETYRGGEEEEREAA